MTSQADNRTGGGFMPWLRLALLVASLFSAPALAAEVSLHHVHGLAYSSDGKKLFVPSHYGLAVYEGGKWSKAAGPEHDYMGFAVTKDAFYSSGHPAPGSGLKNPFGLIRSRDQGKTWDSLGLMGEADFHQMAAGWASNTVYVHNSHPNSRMPQRGIYVTGNSGIIWRHAAARGLAGELIALAPHPTRAEIVAAATRSGLYLSRDRGESFSALVTGRVVTAATFALDGAHLWFASHAGAARHERLDWNKPSADTVALPAFEARDAVGYIAQNPARPDEWAIASFGRDVYVSRDRGKTWNTIARRGATK